MSSTLTVDRRQHLGGHRPLSRIGADLRGERDGATTRDDAIDRSVVDELVTREGLAVDADPMAGEPDLDRLPLRLRRGHEPVGDGDYVWCHALHVRVEPTAGWLFGVQPLGRCRADHRFAFPLLHGVVPYGRLSMEFRQSPAA